MRSYDAFNKAGVVFFSDTRSSIQKVDVLLTCADADRSYVFGNKSYSPLIDSLGEFLNLYGISTRSVSHRLSRLVGNKAYGNPVSLNRELLWISVIARVIGMVKNSGDGKAWREKQLSKLWKHILVRSGAKAVIAIQPDAGLCRAGHELGTEVFDLQHGIMTGSKFNSYYLKSSMLSKTIEELPHGFLCWDKSSAETLSPKVKKNIKVRVIGNPWFIRFKHPLPEDIIVRDENKRFAHLLSSGLPLILVTLQYNLGEYASDYVENNIMADALAEAIQATRNKYTWCLRLHPSQVTGPEGRRARKWLQTRFGNSENVEWEDSSKVALPAILSHSDLHVTHYSSTTKEAAWMGVRTGLLDPNIRKGRKHEELFISERDAGIAETVDLSRTTIIDFIKSAIGKGKGKPLFNMNFDDLKCFINEIKQDTNICKIGITFRSTKV